MATSTVGQHICIMGCGRVGAQLASHFFSQGIDVRIIDTNEDAFLRLEDDKLRQNHTVQGDGTDPGVLERAGITEIDTFIAVTNGDNRNIMAAQIAQIQYNVPRVICRIYDPKRHEIYKRLGVMSVCPTNVGAEEIMRVLNNSAAPKAPANGHAR